MRRIVVAFTTLALLAIPSAPVAAVPAHAQTIAAVNGVFDLRTRYKFDAFENQQDEGGANWAGNCVPASFTAAILLKGFPDIAPQTVMDAIYGPNYRGGADNWAIVKWLENNVTGTYIDSNYQFDWNRVAAAGQAGYPMVISGRVDAETRFAAYGPFLHASLLVAHLSDGTYVVWNVGFNSNGGQWQTYTQAELTSSLFSLAIVGPPLSYFKAAPGGGQAGIDWSNSMAPLLGYAPNPNTNAGVIFYPIGYAGQITGYSNGKPYFIPGG
jgi:hypothetical protein